MLHSTIISKICLVSVGYLSTTTVMQSVATTSSDIMGQFLHQRCISRDDAQKPYPPSLMVDTWSQEPCIALPNRFGGPMSDLTHIQSIWQLCHTFLRLHRSKPRMSLAHGFRNYFIITATVQETTGAEDHMWEPNRKLILYSIVFNDKVYLTFSERYTFLI
jgi:hypothetical protein